MLSNTASNQLSRCEQEFAGYDLIGDVHGCGDSLVLLLKLLGYCKRGGIYEYRNQRKPRQVIFLGDILDRGPKIRESMLIVRDMVQRGSAQIVMGNHEYNALAYTTKKPGSETRYLLDHTPNVIRLISETLEQFANHPRDWKDILSWLYDWPVFLEFQHFRVVHACWDQPLIEQFIQRRPDATIDLDFLIESTDFRKSAARFMSRTIRGASLMLPENISITGSDGYARRAFRVKFWVEDPKTYGDVQFQPDRLDDFLADRLLSDVEKKFIPYYGRDQRPLFIGHYWQSGKPAPLVNNIACLDYSAVKNGRLMAYRMHDEKILSAKSFVWVDGHERLVL